MKVLAINGSPRKTWNTAILLQHALEGAASQGAETELVHLYDLAYTGCTSCFACKVKGGVSYGRCAVNDGLMTLLESIRQSAALILGSPVYLGTVTGEMKSFLEWFIFPYLVYDAEHSSLFPKRMPNGMIYTLGATEDRIKEMGWDRHFMTNELLLNRIVGPSESLIVTDTCQFDDYAKYVAPAFDPEAKIKRCREIFPVDCKKAYEMGIRLAKRASGNRGITG